MLLGRSKLVYTYLLTQILTWGLALFTLKNFDRTTYYLQRERYFNDIWIPSPPKGKSNKNEVFKAVISNGLSGQLDLLALDRYETEHDFSGLGPHGFKLAQIVKFWLLGSRRVDRHPYFGALEQKIPMDLCTPWMPQGPKSAQNV